MLAASDLRVKRSHWKLAESIPIARATPETGGLEPAPAEQSRRVNNFDRAKHNRNVFSEADAPRPLETGPSAPVTAEDKATFT